jgi:hypothetical protein
MLRKATVPTFANIAVSPTAPELLKQMVLELIVTSVSAVTVAGMLGPLNTGPSFTPCSVPLIKSFAKTTPV